jgi:predicted transcriptional regulator
MSDKAILLSIHPSHAEKIITGEKRMEFRRSWTVVPVEVIVIYATSPVQRIVAVAEVKQVFFGSRTSLWNLAKKREGGISRGELFSYLEGKKKAFAIELGRVYAINGGGNPISLFGKDFRPPQSFRYLKEDEYQKINKLVNGRG